MKKFLLIIGAFVLSLGIGLHAQERTVTGKVADENGDGLPGVSVLIKGTSTGVVTDLDGMYSISVSGDGILVYSFVGMLSQEIVVGTRTNIDVTMETDVHQLSEVVVTALGFEAQKDKLGASSSSIGGSDLVKSGETGLLSSMAGKAAGINITQASGDPGAGARILIRGATSITQGLQPLIVVDGIPVSNDMSYDPASGSTNGVAQQSRLNDINPDDVESMEILKGASAAALWGARAANGVIMITTKKGKSLKEGQWSINYTSRYSVDKLNKTLDLQDEYGQGSRGIYKGVFYSGSTPNTAYGDRIADRTGGTDNFITDPTDPLYNGYFEAKDGTKYYAIEAGTALNPHGGKNNQTVYDRYAPLFQNGHSFYNSVGIGTNNGTSNVYLSFSDLSQEGVLIKNSSYDRKTARLNASQVINDFTFTTNMSYTKTEGNRVQQGSNISGLFLGALRTPADFDMTDYVGNYYAPDGSIKENTQRAYRNQLGQRSVSSYDNPLWLMENIINTTEVDRVGGKIEIGYDPLEWLNITGRVGIDNYTDERNEFFPEQASTNAGGLYGKEIIRNSWIQSDLFARANFKINSDISATGLVGVGLSDRQQSTTGGISTNFINPFSPPNLGNAPADAQSAYGVESQIRNLGYYTSWTFDMYDQLFLNLTGRYDYWSSFSLDDNSFFYPAADLAWQFSKVLPTSDAFTFGKLRVAYGTVGRAPNPYETNTFFIQSTYTEGWGPTIDGGLYGGAFRRSSNKGNPAIGPETKTEFEIGTDLRFFNDKLSFSATYYHNLTKDLITRIDLPVSTGFSSATLNGAEIENKGIEIEINGDAYSTEDFNWNVAFNWSRNKNEVLSLLGVQELGLNGFTGSASSAVVGQQLGVLWGDRTDRDDNGDYILDATGFPKLASTPGVLGDPNPDWRAGISNTFTYKDFSVSILIERFQGGDIWNGTRGALTTLGMAGTTGVTSTISAADAAVIKNYAGLTVAEQYPGYVNPDGSYTVRGEVVDYGGGSVLVDERWWSSTGGGFGGPADQFVEDATWTRIRELSLSYNLPTLDIFEKAGIKRASLTATGRNLMLWTNYSGIDPDTNLTGATNGFGLDYFQNPATKSFQFTLNLNF